MPSAAPVPDTSHYPHSPASPGHVEPAPRRLRGVPFVFTAANALIALVAYVVAAPVVSLVASDERIARAANDLAPDVAIVSYGIQPSSLSFYATAPVRRADQPSDVRRAADAGALIFSSTVIVDTGSLPCPEWFPLT